MNNLKQKWKDLSKQEESLEQELSKFLGVKVMSIETRGYIPCVTIDHYQIYTLFKDNHAPKVEPISLSVEDVARLALRRASNKSNTSKSAICV
jgi:flagellar hook-associated protein FlgK